MKLTDYVQVGWQDPDTGRLEDMTAWQEDFPNVTPGETIHLSGLVPVYRLAGYDERPPDPPHIPHAHSAPATSAREAISTARRTLTEATPSLLDPPPLAPIPWWKRA